MTIAGPRPLKGRVALVAGATRGAGRGIARMLGAAGATVYCSGRSVRGAPHTPGRPETIEETAERVTAEGGLGIPFQADHTDEGQVKALIARIRRDHGRLDVLINDIWGGDALTEWGKPLWELDYAQGRRLMDHAVDTHIITSRHAVPLMLPARRGLVVEVTDGVGSYYRGNLFYDLAKTSVIRLGLAQATELRPHGITALTITPGFLRSEAMLEHFGVTEANWKDGIAKDRYFAASESPSYVGRAVAALAADPDIARKSGGVFATWNLYREYGFTDDDGTQPDFAAVLFRTMAEGLAGLYGEGKLGATDRGAFAAEAAAAVGAAFTSLHLGHLLPLLSRAFYDDLGVLGPTPGEPALEALLRSHLDIG